MKVRWLVWPWLWREVNNRCSEFLVKCVRCVKNPKPSCEFCERGKIVKNKTRTRQKQETQSRRLKKILGSPSGIDQKLLSGLTQAAGSHVKCDGEKIANYTVTLTVLKRTRMTRKYASLKARWKTFFPMSSKSWEQIRRMFRSNRPSSSFQFMN